MCFLSTVLGGGMSIGTGLSISRENLSFKKSFALGGFCGLCAGVSALIFWYVLFASLQSSFSWFFTHSSGKKMLAVAGLTCGSTESYIFLPASLFPLSELLLLCTTRTVSSMGILLHILLALIVSDAFGRKHLGRWALILGAGCSILLDIPSFFYDSVDIFDQLHSHNWSHSIFGITLYMLILSGIAFAAKKITSSVSTGCCSVFPYTPIFLISAQPMASCCCFLYR